MYEIIFSRIIVAPVNSFVLAQLVEYRELKLAPLNTIYIHINEIALISSYKLNEIVYRVNEIEIGVSFFFVFLTLVPNNRIHTRTIYI